MSKNVNYLRKILADSFSDATDAVTSENTEFYAARMVFAAYGKKNLSYNEFIANCIVDLLNKMISQDGQFKDIVLNVQNRVHTYFSFAIMQTMGLVADPNRIINEASMTSARLALQPASYYSLYVRVNREAESTSMTVKKYFLGVIISLYLTEFELTPGNSGFASACFVVAKALELPNISQSLWVKMINAANFSAGLLERGSSRSRRAVELSRIPVGRNQGPVEEPLSQDDPPAYEPTPPPLYSEQDNYPRWPRQEFAEPNVLEIVDMPPPYRP